jgi:thiol-disulfide isomerase/thioredoxin
MKRTLFWLSGVICFLLTDCTETKNNEFVLNGTIEGVDTGKIILNYVPDRKPVLDTAQITNGKFIFRGHISEPLLSALFMDRNLNNARFFIEQGSMQIVLARDKFNEFRITGSKSQEEASSLADLEKPENDKLDLLDIELKAVKDSLKSIVGVPSKMKLENRFSEITELIGVENLRIDSIRLAFILNNPKSFVAVYNLQSMIVGNENISIDSIKTLLGKLDTIVRHSKYVNRIRADLRKREVTRIGEAAPDFQAIDLNNDSLRLSDFRNKKVVLLDLWASWCVPCRDNIPHLKQIYKKYNPLGLEIIAVSLDNDKKAWMKAVNDEGTGIWRNIHHGFNAFAPGDYNGNSVYANYFYNTIPTQILIDTDGLIIGIWTGSSTENNSVLEKMLEEVFKQKNL